MERISKSISIDAATLRRVRQIAAKCPYYSVPWVINHILDAVVDGFEEEDIISMAKYVRGFSKNPIGNFIVDNRK